MEWELVKLWVNRFGIALDFLAGFMLTPELIGIDRLRRVEANLESRLSSLESFLGTRRKTLVAVIKPEVADPAWFVIRLLIIISMIAGLLWSLWNRLYYIAVGIVLLV